MSTSLVRKSDYIDICLWQVLEFFIDFKFAFNLLFLSSDFFYSIFKRKLRGENDTFI